MRVTLSVGASGREATPAVEVLLDGLCIGRLAESDAQCVVMRNHTPLDGGLYRASATLLAESASHPPYKLIVAEPRVGG